MNEQQIIGRKQRGYDLFQRYTIQQDGDFWLVPSTKRGKYKVSLKYETCECADYEIHRQRCKHFFAAEFKLNSVFLNAIDDIPAEVKEVPKKKTYPQPNWPAYHRSQVSEKSQFRYLLRDLVSGIESPSQKTGRPRHDFSDLIFGMCYKIYCSFSSRRFMTDLSDAHSRNYINRLPSYNSLIEAFGIEEITPHLHQLIEVSSLPLASIEKDFAVDSTGLTTSRFYQWYFAKYGDRERVINRQEFLKLHAIVGTENHIITGVEISNWLGHDTNYFPQLVDKTAVNFEVREVSADKAYSSEKNMNAVLKHGGMPYIAFKKSATLGGTRAGKTWRNMFAYYSLNSDDFLAHYHKRSNSESAFSMIKAKFGDTLRCKTDTALTNEALAKVVCHNICCLISSYHELGLKPKFWNQLH
jgi:transposase